MSDISGLNGLLSLNGTSAVSTVRDWSITPSNAVVAGAASNTGGAEFNLAGVSDFTGSFNIYSESGLGIAVPGTTYVFYGQTGGGEVMGGIIIDSLAVTCDIENGGVISGAVGFSSIGSSTATYSANNTALTYQAATSLTNASLPDLNSGIVCKAQWGPLAQSLADMPTVRSWSLNLACNNVAFSGSGKGGVRKRVRGRRSATASVQFYEGDLSIYDAAATDYRVGTVGELRLFTSATAYWQMQWGVVSSSPVNTPIETPEMVNNQMDFSWTAFTDISGTITRGTIVDPNAVTYFV